jgi:O-antigen/teichoic acid export membrane protein
MLSRGDFGIAATITLTLQMIEILTDLAPDRFMMQSRTAPDDRLLAVAHGMTLARGLLIGAILAIASVPLARFFGVSEADGSFLLMAAVPLIKGVQHLDSRIAQRALDNRQYLASEIAGQLAALAAAWPLLRWSAGPATVVWLAIVQAAVMTGASHVLARRRYQVRGDGALIREAIAFGWPIWLSAFPLIAVYQADRMIVGYVLGMEALAGYSAAVMMTMVPGLLAAKLGQALVLPLLVGRSREPGEFARVYRLMLEGTVVGAAAYLAVCAIGGGTLLTIVFGPQYHDLELLVAWAGAMWAARMVQAVPGMALMAQGATRPLLLAGLVRAAAVPMALVVATLRLPIEAIAMAGLLGEVASLATLTVALARSEAGRGLARATLVRVAMLTPLIGLIGLAGHERALASTLAITALGVLVAALAVAALMPGMRRMALGLPGGRAAS